MFQARFAFDTRRFVAYFIGLVALAAATAPDAKAVNTRTWGGGTSTDWNTGTNWSGNTVPAAGDTAVIPDAAGTPRDPTLTTSITNQVNLQVERGAIINCGAFNL